MLQRPRLKTHLTIFPLSPTRWGVSGGADDLSRIGLSNERAIRAFTHLLPLLDGRRTAAAIVEQLEGEGVDRRAAEAILSHLEKSDLLEEGSDHGLSPAEVEKYQDQIRFFSRFTSEGGAKFQAALLKSRVAVVETGPGRLAQALQRALLAAGVGEVRMLTGREEPAPWQESDGVAAPTATAPARVRDWRQELAPPLPDLLFVSQQAHDPELLETIDTFSKETRMPWLLVQCLSAQEGWAGPLFVPYDTASYLSLEARLRANLPFADEYRALDDFVRTNGRAAAPAGGLEPSLDVLAGIAASEAVKFLSGCALPELVGRFLTVNLVNWATELHDVLRVPSIDRPPAGPTPFPWKEEIYASDDANKRRA